MTRGRMRTVKGVVVKNSSEKTIIISASSGVLTPMIYKKHDQITMIDTKVK